METPPRIIHLDDYVIRTGISSFSVPNLVLGLACHVWRKGPGRPFVFIFIHCWNNCLQNPGCICSVLKWRRTLSFVLSCPEVALSLHRELKIRISPPTVDILCIHSHTPHSSDPSLLTPHFSHSFSLKYPNFQNLLVLVGSRREEGGLSIDNQLENTLLDILLFMQRLFVWVFHDFLL